MLIGTETEFGILVPSHPEISHIDASDLVVSELIGGEHAVSWNMETETPGEDLRGREFRRPASRHIQYGGNLVMANGARVYIDHAHPEFSGPECISPYQAALYDKAGERIMSAAVTEISQRNQMDLRLYKNNSDGKGNSYGWHENYLISREVGFGYLVRTLSPFLVTRQIFTGSGKVGSENHRPHTDFQISQRADFFEELVGLETTSHRPIINTRDEPHTDPDRYRRLHLIVGDANLSEFQTWLKLGTTALVLSAIEAGFLTTETELATPVTANWQVSHDTELSQPLSLDDSTVATALELQYRYLEQCQRYVTEGRVSAEWEKILVGWQEILEDLEADPDRTTDRLDWTAKRKILSGIQNRYHLGSDDPRLKTIDIQYHDLDGKRSLYQRLIATGSMRTIFGEEELAAAVAQPPPETRAYLRGEIIRRYPKMIKLASWEGLLFRLDSGELRYLSLADPYFGNREQVQSLLTETPPLPIFLDKLPPRLFTSNGNRFETHQEERKP